jgi:hypothetical protein
MKQPAVHVPPLQTCPAAHPIPFDTFVHVVVLVPGWQDWQALLGFGAPDV